MAQRFDTLLGLWEYVGFRDPEHGTLLEDSDKRVVEFLYFAADRSFFWAKYVRDGDLAFDPDTQRFVSDPPLDPQAEGKWVLEGTTLRERIAGQDGENRMEVPEVTDDRLVVREPAKGGQTLDIVYRRDDIERFPAPPLAGSSSREIPTRAGIQARQQEVRALLESGKLNTAHRLAQRCVQWSEQIFGDRHPNTAACLSILGGVLVKVGDPDRGIVELERSRAIAETSTTLNNLSMAGRAAKRYRLALEAAVRAVRMRIQEGGYGAVSTMTSIQNLGWALSGLGHLGPALDCYRAAGEGGEKNRKALLERRSKGFPFAGAACEERAELAVETAVASVLDEAERMLESGPVDEGDFVLECGRPADDESYRHFATAIKSAAVRSVDVARARRRLIEGCKVPLTLFDGVLKRTRRSSLGPICSNTLQHAFPAFDGTVERSEERNALLAKHGIDADVPTLARERVRNARALGYPIKLVEQQFRRYAGAKNLPRQRYAAVCCGDGGDDRQTLARELFEYTDPRVPGFVFVGDTSDAELMARMPAAEVKRVADGRAGIFVFLLPLPEEEQRAVFRDAYGPILELLHGPYATAQGQWDGMSVVFIPVEIVPVEIDGVLDLRRRDAQEWFFRFFRHGDGAVFVKNTETSVEGFLDMLPALVYPEYGGSGFTKSAGSWLRTAGVSGLVYPSARSDASVTYDSGGVPVDWHGWNFVDYRDLAFAPDDLVHYDDNDWYDFVAARQEAPALEVTDHSWTVCGAEHRYRVTRDFFLQLLESPTTRPV